MLRPTPLLHRILLFGLLPVYVAWVAWMSFSLRDGHVPWLGFAVSAPTSGLAYPIVSAVDLPAPGYRVQKQDPSASRSLQVGDELLRAGDFDLQGATPVGLRVAIGERFHPGQALQVEVRRDGRTRIESLDLSRSRVAVGQWWQSLVSGLLWPIVPVLLILRAPRSGLGPPFLLASLSAALTYAGVPAGPAVQTYVLLALKVAAGAITASAYLLFAHRLSRGSARPARGPYWPLLFALLGATASSSWNFGIPFEQRTGVFVLSPIMTITWLGAMATVTFTGYRSASPRVRRQMRWVLFGFLVGYAPALLNACLELVGVHGLVVIAALRWIGPFAVPASVLVAILWRDFLDIDRILSAAATINVLMAGFFFLAMLAVPAIASALSEFASVQGSAYGIAAGILAGLLLLTYGRLHTAIERVFFPERYALLSGIGSLLAETDQIQGPEDLLYLPGKRLAELLQPRHFVGFSTRGDQLVPILEMGRTRTDTKPIALSTPVGTVLRRAEAPICQDQQSHFGNAPLPLFHLAVLEELDARVLVPVRSGEDLIGLYAFGKKQSGDVYTSADLGCLATTAQRIGVRFNVLTLETYGRRERDLPALRSIPSPEGWRSSASTMPSETATWEGTTLASRYRVDRLLGEGGMAFVFLANDERLERPVVVKVPRPSILSTQLARTRFVAEVRNLAKLEHPAVVGVQDWGEHLEQPYAVLAYKEGGDLTRLRAQHGGRLSTAEISTWLPSIAAALDYLHGRGLIHRDIKPDNILFDGRGNPFVSDLGIAVGLLEAGMDSDGTGGLLTYEGKLLGNPTYMPPEALGQRLSPAYDQYSLAVVVYEALAGTPPFDSSRRQQMTAKLLTAPTPLRERNPSVPEGVESAVMRALARTEEGRFRSCSEFASAFERAVSTST